MKTLLYRLWQCTWGIIQSGLGLVVFLLHIGNRHFSYHGAVVTVWDAPSSVSLGMFVFVTGKPYFYDETRTELTLEALSRRLLVHEYGHTIQSAILGPLYLILMGIPSTLWGFLPACRKKRKQEGISYFSFFTERWANVLGERVTGQSAMGDMIID